MERWQVCPMGFKKRLEYQLSLEQPTAGLYFSAGYRQPFNRIGRLPSGERFTQQFITSLHRRPSALARLDSLEGAVAAPETVAALKRRHEDRRAYFVAACQDIVRGDVSSASAALQLQFVDAERASIADLYYLGEIGDEARRRIERELDLEDSRIRHVAESGAARAL